MKKPTVMSLLSEKGQTDIVEIIRAIFIIVVLAYVGWVAAGVFGVQEIVGTILVGTGILAVSALVAYLVYEFSISVTAAIVVFLSLVGLLAAIIFGVPTVIIESGKIVLIGTCVGAVVVLGMYFSYRFFRSKKEAAELRRKIAFEEGQRRKGLVKFVNRFGNEKWGTPKDVKKWEKEDFEKKQIERGLVEYKDEWITPAEKFEREQLAKGFVKYVDRFGTEIWDKPAKIKKLKKIDDEEGIKESLWHRVVEAIRKFEPARKLRDEYVYENSLYSWLKSQFPEIRVQMQKGSSRPDIIINNVAIEIKGPTRRKDQLESVSDKCMRYRLHWEKIIVVLFDVTVGEPFYDEWLKALKNTCPEVEVIRKD